MQSRYAFVVAVAIAIVLGSPLGPFEPSPSRIAAAQAGAATQAPPVFRVEVGYVHVDVTVTDDRGGFVGDLQTSDFEVYEDGKRQELLTSALVDLPSAAAATSPPSGVAAPAAVEPDARSNETDNAGRVYVIVLDDLHVAPLRSSQVQRVAREFIERYVGPGDLAAVVHTSGRADASQDFTPRRSLLLRAVDAFAGRKLRSSVLEALADFDRRRNQANSADVRLRRPSDPLDAQRADQARQALNALTSVSELLARATARRKAVLFVSEGIDYPMEEGVAQTASGLTTFTREHAADVRRDAQRATRTAAGANVSIYAVDPRGLTTTADETIEMSSFPENPQLGLTPKAIEEELRQAQQTLRLLSEETGGVAAVASNDFRPTFQRIVDDSSRYYLLGYRSSNKAADGRYRTIDVRVRRPGLRVRARPGYIASAPDRRPALFSADAEPSSVLREALNAPLPVASVPMRISAAPFRSPSSVSLAVTIEIDASRFRFTEQNGLFTDTVEVVVAAVDRNGKVRGGDRQTVKLQLKPDTLAAVRTHGMRLLFRLNAAAERYQLRAAVHDSGSGAAGSALLDVDAADVGRPLALSGLVLTAPTAARIPTARQDPLFDGTLPSPPTATRTFQAGETLTTFFEVYAAASSKGGAVGLVTTVRDADGRVRFKSEAQEGGAAAGEAGFGYAQPIALGDLPPGAYVLRVEARGPGGAAARELPFAIAPKGGR